jgi:hypothetical protein
VRGGQLLYLLVSLACFAFGLHHFLRSIHRKLGFDLRFSKLRSVFWLMLGWEVIRALLNAQPDLFIAGAVLLSTSLMLHNEFPGFAGALLATVASWKFQTLVLMVLPFTALWYLRRRESSITGMAAGTVFSFLAPFLFLHAKFVASLYLHWGIAFAKALRTDWLSDSVGHIFTFAHSLSVPVSLPAAIVLSLLCVVALVVYLLTWLHPLRSHPNPSVVLVSALLIGLGLGSAYISAITPLCQSNEYILYTPMLLPVLVFSILTDRDPRIVSWILFISFLLISVIPSGILPLSALHGRNPGTKPLGIILLSVWLFATLTRYRSYLRAQTVSAKGRRL